ncbi:MAG: extracellular solute-binding protein [Oscillospiraceae bacterium]|nr:extracellular solute-binding protein [Oscillospiraceae bacterium]
MHKKMIYLLVALCFAAAAVLAVSCGGETKDGSPVGEKQPDDEKISDGDASRDAVDPAFADELPALDFGGKTFNFLVDSDPAFRHLYDVNVEGEIGEIVNDTIYKRNRTVEERLNIKIEDVESSGAQKTITNAVASGDTTYTGVWLLVDRFFSASLAGPFANLYNVPHLDLGKKYWDPNAVGDMTISGKLYGMTGDITTATNMFTHLLLYNKSLGADYGFPNLYNLVREGKWTFDKFAELTKDIYKDLNGNGKADVEDFFSVYITPAAYEAFFSSAGEKWVEKNAAGEIVFSEMNEKKIAVLDKIEGMFTKKDNVWCGYEQPQPFTNERAIFYDGDLGIMSEEYRDLEVDFGILPLPKFSEEQNRYYVYAYPFFPFLSIPTTITGEELEMAGAALEALASESYKTLTPAFYEIALANKYVRDEESYEMLDIILRSRIYDLLYWGQWDSFRNWGSGLVSAMQKGGGVYVSTYEKNIDKAIKKIDEIVDIYANLD